MHLASEGSGRIGGARLGLHDRAGETQVDRVYEQIPIRLAPLNFGPTEPALVYLINPTAGLMDGDAHLFKIHAQPNTRALVAGQSASRMHPCVNGFCTQQWTIEVGDDAVLVVLPGPAIPFAGTRFFQRVNVELGRNARFIWGDVWHAGRYARAEASERFRFECIVQEMTVRRAGAVVYRDRFAWHGPWSADAADWHFAGHPVAGSVFVAGATETFSADSFTQTASTRTAIFPTFAGDTCCRIMGPSDAVVRAVVENSLRIASTATSGCGGKSWLITDHHLAHVHWFNF